MGDTIADDPEPPAGPTAFVEEPERSPTLPDGPALPVANAPPRKRRLLLFVAALLSLIVVLAAALFYVVVVRYEPVARLHVPGNANFAVRFEAADLALFGPVRKQLLPLLEGPSSASAPPAKSRAQRIHDATGVDVRIDLRELVVASVDATNWVLVAGGHIPRGRFVRGMEKVLREEGVNVRAEGDLLIVPPGFVLGQAEDGAIVLGTNASMATAALPASDDWQRLGLPDHGAAAFAIAGAAFSAVAPLASHFPHGSALGHVAHASGTIDLGSKPSLDARFEPTQEVTGAALAGELDALVSDLKLVTVLLPDVYGEKAALTSLAVKAAPDAAAVHADWPYDGIDRAVADLAGLMSLTAPH